VAAMVIAFSLCAMAIWSREDFGQAIKGVWWMPWGKEPMKGAASGETRRGAANML